MTGKLGGGSFTMSMDVVNVRHQRIRVLFEGCNSEFFGIYFLPSFAGARLRVVFKPGQE